MVASAKAQGSAYILCFVEKCKRWSIMEAEWRDYRVIPLHL